jgi:uncharacterized lipoprotein YajG
MSRLLFLLLAAAALASCAEGSRIFNNPEPVDAQERAGTRDGVMTGGAGGTIKGL